MLSYPKSNPGTKAYYIEILENVRKDLEHLSKIYGQFAEELEERQDSSEEEELEICLMVSGHMNEILDFTMTGIPGPVTLSDEDYAEWEMKHGY